MEILQALYWLITGNDGGLLENALGGIWGREIVIPGAVEFIEEGQAAAHSPASPLHPGLEMGHLAHLLYGVIG